MLVLVLVLVLVLELELGPRLVAGPVTVTVVVLLGCPVVPPRRLT